MFRPLARALLLAAVASACRCGPSLEVVTATPEGEQESIPRLTRFLLSKPLFDAAQPLPASLPLPEVRITPAVPFRASISSPMSVDVEFAQPLVPAQAYEVTLLAGLATLDGKDRLSKERAVRFRTPINRPSSLAVFDASGKEVGGTFVNPAGKLVSPLVRLGPEEGLALAFAFPIAQEQLSLVKLFVKDGAPVPVKITRDEADARRVRLTPEQQWPRDTPLVLSVAPGVRVDQPKAGPLVSTQTFAFELRTWGALTATGPDTTNACLGSRTLPVTFSNPVKCDDTLSHMELDIADRQVKCVSDATQRLQRYEITPMPPADAPVTVTFTPGLADAFGEVTTTPLSFSFQPCEAAVQFAYTKPFAILDPGQNAEAVERLHGSKSLKVEGIKLSVSEAWDVLRKQGLTDQVAWTELPWWLAYGGWGDDMDGDGVSDQKLPGELDGTVIDALARAKSVTLEVKGDKEWNDVAIPLKPFLGGDKGLVLLRETPLSPAGKANGRPVLRLANVTDIGMTARLSQDGLVLLSARYSDAKPIGGVRIEVRTEDGKPLGEGTTGDDGLLVLPVTALSGLSKMRAQQLMLVATKGDDEAFLWTRFVVDETYGGDELQLVGLVYSDRGIYRPGEKGHVRAVVRYASARGFDSVAGQKARFELYDPDETLSASADVVMSAYSSMEQPLSIPANARVGTWRATLSLGSSSVATTFEVGEFRRAEMKVEIQAPPRLDWGATLTAMIHGDYLFGAPASGQKLSWSLLRAADPFRSKLVPDASFNVPGRDEWGWNSAPQQLLADGETKLDAQGNFTLTQPLKLPNPVGQREVLTISASVEDANGQSVSRLAQVELYAAKVVVGLVGGSYLAEKGKPHKVTAIALTPDDTASANTPIRVLTRESGWRSVRRAGPGGGYYWTSERVEKPEVVRCAGKSDAKGLFECSFSPEAGGSLQVIAEASDASGRAVRTGSWRWVWGDPDFWSAGDDSPRVDLRFDKETVDAGEPLKVAIGSPFKEGLALVTVERETILWQKVIPVTASTQIEIPTDPSWAPNVHVIASVISARQKPGTPPDPAKEKPQFAIGRRIANVRPQGRSLEVKVLTAKERLEPGQEQVASVVVSAPGAKPVADVEVNLWAVDEGVLMLTGYRTPDLLASMYEHRGLRSIGLDTRAYVLGKRVFVEPVIKGEEDGGGGGDEADKTRKNFDPLAVWVGSAITDANGRVEAKFNVPDNLTTYRVMVVAGSKDDRFGRGEGAFKVNKPLMLRQALSRFARPGDSLRVGVLVNQLTGQNGTATVTLDTIDERLFKVGSPRKVEVPVEQGATVPVLFDLSAQDVEGASEIVFSASMGSHKDRVQFNLPVKRQTPRESVSASGVIASGAFQGSLKLPDQARAEALELNVSGFPISAMETRLREMVGYPYGCLEQKTSKVLPLLAIRKLGQDLKMASIPADQIKGWVEEYISIIPKYRCANDGFDYWPGCKFGASTILSAFALEGMLTARKYGFDVPQVEIDKTVGFLRQMVRDGSQGRDQYGGDGLVDYEFVGALRVLAEAGKPEPEIEKARFAARARLPLFGKTDLVRAMASHLGKDAAKDPSVKTLLDEIGAKGRETANGLTFDAEDPARNWQAWESPQRNTAVVLHTLTEIVPADGRIPLLVKGLVDLDASSRYYITSDTTQTLLALVDAIPLMNSGKKLAASVSANGQKLGDEALGATVKSWSVPGASLAGEIPLEIVNQGDGPVFFGAYLKYAYPATARLPASANGFVLEREYLGQDGKPLPVAAGPDGVPVLALNVGDFVQVRVKVKLSDEGRLVVVEDPLPAGLEPVDAKLATSDTAALAKMQGAKNRWWDEYHRELRDDRVEWHFENVWRGDMELSYVARAATAGTFYAPGSHAERMYQPHVNGRSSGLVVRVSPKAK